MKRAWNAVCIIALANLLAVAGFVGWLKSSDRLSMDRMRQLKVMLGKTLTQEKSEQEATKAKADEEEKAAAAAKLAAKPPLTAAERLAARVEANELDSQRAERLKREVLDMKRQLEDERVKLDARDEKLKADRKAFEEMVSATTAAATDGQFQKTLAVLESLKPAQAIALLKEMMPDPAAANPDALSSNSGPVVGGTGAVAAPSGKNIATVVGYLDAMDEKHRAAIMKELSKNDAKLAAHLLERIRKQGDFARVP